MNYTDVGEIIKDDFTGHIYGDKNQLRVLGWSGKSSDGKKLYVVFCEICSLDRELFGDALYRHAKSNILVGQTPCGCSKKPVWTERQLKTRLSRYSKSQGYEFIGWASEYKKSKTKLILKCKDHGLWDTMVAANFMTGQSCPKCADLSRVSKLTSFNTYEDDIFIKSFFETGFYEAGTVFKRSNNLSKRGFREYWTYECRTCGCSIETTAQKIKMGTKSCFCSSFNPCQAYIKILSNDNGPIAIKYGIAKVAQNRVHRNCLFNVQDHSFWKFADKNKCISAESACHSSLDNRFVTKDLMPDGYTETTSISNLKRIIDIYKSFGGELIEEFSCDISY